MSYPQPTRKRQHQQQSRAVKEAPQEEEETQSIGAGISASASHCFSSNLGENNLIGLAAAGGNGGDDDINQLKLKMAALEAKNHILEGILANQELNARIHSMNKEGILSNLKQENRALWMRLNEVEENAKTNDKKMMDEFAQTLAVLEAKHQQEIAGLWEKIKYAKSNPQQQPATANCRKPDSDSDCVVVDMEESLAALIPPPPIAPNLMPCHSADLPDCVVNMQESSHAHGNLNTLDERLYILASRHRQQTTRAAVATVIPPPPIAVTLNPVPVPLPSRTVQQEVEEGEVVEVEAKRLCNPLENSWNANMCKATIKITKDGLAVHNTSPLQWGNIGAQKGFPVTTSRQLHQNHFAGPKLYYYEIKIKSSSKHNERQPTLHWFSIGSVQKGSWIGMLPNTYAMQEDKRDYCLLSGNCQLFEWPAPAEAIKPKWYGYGCRDVYGCGLVLSADNKLAIFFTTNGILMGKQIAIHHLGSILYPCLQLNRDVTVEANFGQKPFKYNIDECPGLQLQW